MSIFCRHKYIYRVEVNDTSLNVGAPITVWRKCKKCDAHKIYFRDEPAVISRNPTEAEMFERFKMQ